MNEWAPQECLYMRVWKKEREWDGITNVKERVLDVREVNTGNFAHDWRYPTYLNFLWFRWSTKGTCTAILGWLHHLEPCLGRQLSLDIYILFMNTKERIWCQWVIILRDAKRSGSACFISKKAKINMSPASGEQLTPLTSTAQLKKVTHNS